MFSSTTEHYSYGYIIDETNSRIERKYAYMIKENREK